MGVFSAGKKRGQEVTSDMVRSLAVVLGFVLVAGVWFLFARPHSGGVRTVDYGAQVRAARSVAPYHVVAPAGLSSAWRATSARYDRMGRTVTFHVGFLTPRGDYAGLDETDGDAAAFVRGQLGAHPRELSTITIGGAVWRELRGARDELAVARTDRGVTLVVHGTAGMGELVTLAGTLR